MGGSHRPSANLSFPRRRESILLARYIAGNGSTDLTAYALGQTYGQGDDRCNANNWLDRSDPLRPAHRLGSPTTISQSGEGDEAEVESVVPRESTYAGAFRPRVDYKHAQLPVTEPGSNQGDRRSKYHPLGTLPVAEPPSPDQLSPEYVTENTERRYQEVPDNSQPGAKKAPHSFEKFQ